MQKKLLFVLSTVLFFNVVSVCGVETSIKDWPTSQKIGFFIGVGALLAAGKYAEKMNAEYTKQAKKPDAKMAAVKIATAGVVLLGSDILFFNTGSMGENLIKLAVFGISLGAGSDQVAEALSYIPCIGGILTGPIDRNGAEVKEAGAAARVLLTYLPLRGLALHLFGYSDSEKKKI